MNSVRRGRGIVVGVDGSEPSRRALQWALAEATRRRCDVRLVHAETWYLESVEQQAEARRLLSQEVEYAASLASDVEVTAELHDAAPVSALLAEGRGAELIVIGNRGRGGFASLALGSVGVQLASHAPCPLVVVRRAEPEPDTGAPAARIVVGLDGSPMSELALDFAFQEASLRGTGLIAVRAWTMPASLPPGLLTRIGIDLDLIRQEEETLLSHSLAGWPEKYPGVPVVEKAPLGHVAHALIEESRGAELVVVGSRGRGGFEGLVLGSTSQALLHHATCPVAVVRSH